MTCTCTHNCQHDYKITAGMLPIQNGKAMSELQFLAKQSSRIDPTKTLTLRTKFAREAARRFRELKKAIKYIIVDDDCFGLNPIRFKLLQSQFSFPRTEDKVAAFMDWLKKQDAEIILKPGRLGALNEQWTNTYIQSAYRKGQQSALQKLKAAGIDVPVQETGPFSFGFFNPIHADRLGAIYTRVFSDLKGITEAMDVQISRVLTEGMMQGWNPMKLAKALNAQVDKIGINRARMLARTEVVRAHHLATVQEYRNYGIAGVKVLAEWLTSGWNVCPECSALEGKTFTLDEIELMLPRHPNCLIDGQVKVYTSKGWRQIKDIKVGAHVLTHRGRFKKVVQIHHTCPNKKVNAVKLYLDVNTQQNRLSVTEEHPVLVNGHWKAAKDIKKGDQIEYLADSCRRCGELIPYYNKYCSLSCNSKDIANRQWADPMHRKNMSVKISKSLKKQYETGVRDKDKITKSANRKVRELVVAGEFVLQRPEIRDIIRKVTNLTEHRRRSSERMRRNNPTKSKKVRDKIRQGNILRFKEKPHLHPNHIMARKGFISSIERKMKDLLDGIGVKYVHQYNIGNYWVDFAIPELKIVIECDGEYWHQDKEKDQARQCKIEQEGWFVLRYTDAKINECLNEVQDELMRVVCNHEGKFSFISRGIAKVDRWQLRRKGKLYNLSVEDDESYVANGFVVHNCRCSTIPAIADSKADKEFEAALKDSIGYYRGAGYDVINGYLRTGEISSTKLAKAQRAIETLNSQFAKEAVREFEELYRGVSADYVREFFQQLDINPKKMLIGGIRNKLRGTKIALDGFISTSEDIGIVEKQFATEDASAIFHISGKSKVLDFNSLAPKKVWASEKEMLLPHATEFIITDIDALVEANKLTYHIYMEVI